MERTKIKLCGRRRPEDIKLINEVKPDFAGFIINFPKSFRSLSAEEASVLTKELKSDIISVGVLVNQPVDFAERLVNRGIVQVLQLHGEETPEYIRELKNRTDARIIKVFKVKSREALSLAEKSPADDILLDKGYGEGQAFDWNLIEKMERPFFLAGGLGEHNLKEAVQRFHPYAVDMSSCLETDHCKDPAKVRNIMQIMKGVTTNV